MQRYFSVRGGGLSAKPVGQKRWRVLPFKIVQTDSWATVTSGPRNFGLHSDHSALCKAAFREKAQFKVIFRLTLSSIPLLSILKARRTALLVVFFPGGDNAVQLRFMQRGAAVSLDSLSLRSCLQPDTQFHSNKHEIGKDQIQTARNWKCGTVGWGVWMRSPVCVSDHFGVLKSVCVCVSERQREKEGAHGHCVL